MYKPIKSLGQNFLMNFDVVTKMVSFLGPLDFPVVEIGPGLGVLTEELIKSRISPDVSVYAVEVDTRFVQKLNDQFVTEQNVFIIQDDILKWLPTFSMPKFNIIGSLPYYITSPIIHSIIQMNIRPDTVVLLIQKEVAEKISARAPDSSYMSAFVQTFYDVEYKLTVPAKDFNPAPAVDGGVLVLKRKTLVWNDFSIEKYIGFLHKAFSHPRKMLNKCFSPAELNAGGINPNLRPQNLSALEWLEFYKIIRDL